jgi:hypothetical protein
MFRSTLTLLSAFGFFWFGEANADVTCDSNDTEKGCCQVTDGYSVAVYSLTCKECKDQYSSSTTNWTKDCG